MASIYFSSVQNYGDELIYKKKNPVMMTNERYDSEQWSLWDESAYSQFSA